MASATPTEKGTGAVKTAKPKVMTVAISDEKALYLSYMPFLANGGIFVPTDATYTVGDPVFLILKLPDNDQQAVPGTVAWITPVGAQSGRTAGVGIHFNSPEGEPIRKRIEALLTGKLNSDRATYSM
jgi:type IV pilus assembly protein PilZ